MTRKFDLRGGKRVKNKNLSSCSRMLDVIWAHFAGVTECAKLIGVANPQTLINWRNEGKVPLNKIGNIVKKLRMDFILLFNYEEGQEYLGSKCFISWKDLVQSAKEDGVITEDEARYILKGKLPKEPK